MSDSSLQSRLFPERDLWLERIDICTSCTSILISLLLSICYCRYVSNIHPNTSKDQLQHLFSSCGCIRHVTIPKSSATQQPLGHAYIEFSSPAAAQAAVKLSRQQLQGQQISVHLKQTNIQGYDVFQGHVGFSRRGRRGMGGTGNSFGRQGAAFPEWGQ